MCESDLLDMESIDTLTRHVCSPENRKLKLRIPETDEGRILIMVLVMGCQGNR